MSEQSGGEMSASISISELQKIELRVATIIGVEEHPNADRLYVVQVDLGSQTRQIVAGIRCHYPKEQLLGRQVIVVANLAPAVLRGKESQGMLLAAGDGTRLALLEPDRPVANGAAVR